MSSLIDLHIHTTASDGSDTVAVLLENIRRAGLHTFAITDHDTVAGAAEMQQLVPHDLRFIPGIEFSCITRRGKCHILGYGMDWNHPEFRSALNLGAQLRKEKLERRIAFLEERFGIRLTEQERCWITGQKSPGKPHLARILVDRGIAPDVHTAIQKYINLLKDKNDRIEASIAIRAIRSAGGIPVWAHPLGGEGEKRLSKEQFQAQFTELLACGIQGLECYYSRYSPDDAAFLTAAADSAQLLISGGSDYHGTTKANLPLGKLNDQNTPVEPKLLTLSTKRI